MKSWKINNFKYLTAVFLTGLIVPLSAATTSNPIVDQGDILLFKEGEHYNSCTTGYVDDDSHVAVTAGICGDKGDKVYNTSQEMVGEIMSINYLGRITVKLDNNVVAGENKYSGDKILSHQDVNPGNEVCGYGGAGSEKCGSITGFGLDKILTNGFNINETDNGGPLYVKGEGFLGVMNNERKVSEWYPEHEDDPKQLISLQIGDIIGKDIEEDNDKEEGWFKKIINFLSSLF